MRKIVDKFYDSYKNFAIYLFILQNILLFVTILVSYPHGEVLITTNSINELVFEIVWTGLLVISSIAFGIIHFKKNNEALRKEAAQLSQKSEVSRNPFEILAQSDASSPVLTSSAPFISVLGGKNTITSNSVATPKVSASPNTLVPKQPADFSVFSSIIYETPSLKKVDSEEQRKKLLRTLQNPKEVVELEDNILHNDFSAVIDD